MAINTTLESVSTTAASNGPSGSDQRTIADDGLRQYVAFTKMLKVSATLASGSTVTPPSTANVFSVSGVTTINTIASTNSWDGRDIYFIFQGALTLTHSSNLSLPGAANITTAANDVAHLIQTGSGAWLCDHYQPHAALPITSYLPLAGGTVTGATTFSGNFSATGGTLTLGDASGDALTINATTTVAGTAGAVIQNIVGQQLYKNVSNDVGGLKVYSDVNGDAYLVETFAGNMFFATDNQVRLALTSDGRLYGLYLHNNAGAVTGTTNQYIASGTYTPDLTNTTNIDASTAYECQWIRVGNVVLVSGRVDIDPTLASAITMGMSLPIASDFTQIYQLAGTGCADRSAGGGTPELSIEADTTNNRATFEGLGSSTVNLACVFQFTYVVV